MTAALLPACLLLAAILLPGAFGRRVLAADSAQGLSGDEIPGQDTPGGETPGGETPGGEIPGEEETESESETQDPEKDPSKETEPLGGSYDSDGMSEADETGENVVELAAHADRPEGTLKKIGKNRYYVLKDGSVMKDVWLKIGSSVYYFGSDGSAWTGSHSYKDKQYYFDAKGRLYIKRFRKKNSARYYYAEDGAMVCGRWFAIRGNMYYFYSSGKMARSCWVHGCYLSRSGKLDFRTGKGSTKRFKATGRQRLIIVGASRVKQMGLAVHTDKQVIYIAKSGKGLDWFSKTGLSQLKKRLKKYPKSKVVIQLGNNDLTGSNTEALFREYETLYRSLIKQYPKASFYLMDVLPRKPLDHKENDSARRFNALLKAAFPDAYIGGYTYMVEKGFSTSYNQSHYTVKTSRDIFNYILKKVQ